MKRHKRKWLVGGEEEKEMIEERYGESNIIWNDGNRWPEATGR